MLPFCCWSLADPLVSGPLCKLSSLRASVWDAPWREGGAARILPLMCGLWWSRWWRVPLYHRALQHLHLFRMKTACHITFCARFCRYACCFTLNSDCHAMLVACSHDRNCADLFALVLRMSSEDHEESAHRRRWFHLWSWGNQGLAWSPWHITHDQSGTSPPCNNSKFRTSLSHPRTSSAWGVVTAAGPSFMPASIWFLIHICLDPEGGAVKES